MSEKLRSYLVIIISVIIYTIGYLGMFNILKKKIILLVNLDNFLRTLFRLTIVIRLTRYEKVDEDMQKWEMIHVFMRDTEIKR